MTVELHMGEHTVHTRTYLTTLKARLPRAVILYRSIIYPGGRKSRCRRTQRHATPYMLYTTPSEKPDNA